MLYLPNTAVAPIVCYTIIRPRVAPCDGSFIIELGESSIVRRRDERSCGIHWSVDSGDQIGGTAGTGEWGLGVATHLKNRQFTFNNSLDLPAYFSGLDRHVLCLVQTCHTE